MTKFNFYKFALVSDTKRPAASQNNPKNWYKSSQPGGILTGNYTTFKGEKQTHKNNISVVDIDFFKKQTEEQIKNNLFIKEFGTRFIEKFKTYTVKTQSGGYHLYFKYVDLPTCVSGMVRKGLDIDFLNNGRYVVGAGCKVKKNKYTVHLNRSIKKMPESLYNFIRDVLPKPKPKKQKKYIDSRREYNKNKQFIKNQFSYDIDDNTFNEIIENMGDGYFSSYTEFLKFTTFSKILNKKNEWDKISKSKPNYNKDNNMIIWDNCKTNNNIVNYFLKYTTKVKSYIKYKKVDCKTNTKPHYNITRKKLGLLDDGKPTDIIQDILDDHPETEAIIIKSDTGTGKTTSMSMYLERTREDFISVVSRVSLGEEQSKKVFNEKFNLNSIFYKDVKGFFDEGNIVIQIESLIRLMNVNLSDYVLFLDEYSSILEHLLKSSTLDNRRCVIFQMFRRIIRECKLVICVDADINGPCIEFLKLLKKNVVYVVNNYKHNQSVKATEIETFEEIIEKLKVEESFFICTDSKSRGEKIKKLLNNDSIKLITSDTIEYIDLDKFDKIIISPKVIYGLDSTIKRPVYCVFQGNTISPPQMVQQIARVRNITHLYYNFIKKNIREPRYENLKDCVECLINSNNLSIKEFELVYDKNITDIYINFLSKIEYKLDCMNTNKFYHFRQLLKQRGFIINKQYFKNQTINKTKEKELIEMIKNDKLENIEFYRKQINQYLNVPDDVDEYDEIFIDQYKLLTHWNITKFFYKFDTSDDISIRIQQGDNDYPVNLTHSTNSKLYFLKQLLEKTEADGIQPTKTLEKKEGDEIYIKYKTIFQVRSKKLNFSKMNDINKTLNRIYKDLFKNYITCVRKGRNKEYIFNIDQNQFDYHKKLFNYRSNVVEYIEDFKEDHIKILKI